MRIKNGFSIIELTVVVVIIGILATLVIGYYTTAKENAADKEASANLRNIQVAERSYVLDHFPNYYPTAGSEADIGTINTNLKLSLPTAANRNWDYVVFSNGCAQATRTANPGKIWFLTVTDGFTAGDGEPNSGACP